MTYHVDFYAFEAFFVRHVKEFTHFIELGTGNGGTSLYLLLLCIQRNRKFNTFDIRTPTTFWTPIAKMTHIEEYFHELNLFEIDIPEFVETYFRHPMTLFCDNGNKRKEVEMFHPYLVPGDFLIVHDWGSEFTEKDVRDNMEMILQEECEEIDSRLRFWRIS